jgi:hypothetical protein
MRSKCKKRVHFSGSGTRALVPLAGRTSADTNSGLAPNAGMALASQN